MSRWHLANFDDLVERVTADYLNGRAAVIDYAKHPREECDKAAKALRFLTMYSAGPRRTAEILK